MFLKSCPFSYSQIHSLKKTFFTCVSLPVPAIFAPDSKCPGTIYHLKLNQISSVQLLSHIWLFRPHGLQHPRLLCPSPTPGAYSNSCPPSRWCPLTISSSVIPFSSHLQSSISIRVFSNESVLCIKWPEYWGFSFSISPSNEYSGLIPLRIHWLDLLAVQETLKSLFQHHSSKTSVLQHSAIVQLLHPYMTTVKGFDIINKAEVDVFLELSCFFDDPMDVGNLISGSSAFCKSSLNIWKFLVPVLLNPGL